jgi:predicted AlkP superfamily pyrophosphatase or phosphodiesterase
MKTDTITLFIVLDACRHDYLKHAPYMESIADWRGIVKEPFGFISTRPAMCAGVHPEQTGKCFEYVYRPDGNTFSNPLFRLLGMAARLFPASILRLAATAWVRITNASPVVRRTAMVRNMPLELLHLFDYAEKVLQNSAGHLPGHPTIFDLVREEGQRSLYLGFARSKGCMETVKRLHSVLIKKDFLEADRTMVDRFVRSVDRARPDFAHLHFSACDWVGHVYGPDSSQMRDTVKEVDRLVQKVHEAALRACGNVRIVVTADHGMVEVEQHHDIGEVLSVLPCREPEDYIMFRDSTMARFWFFNDSAFHAVTDALNDLSWGRIMAADDLERLHIRFNDNSNGDIFFVLDGGHVLLPNYYQDSGAPPRGMHGYLPDVADNQGLFLLSNPPSDSVLAKGSTLDMVDVFPTLLDMHGLRRPEGSHGVSVLHE